MATKRPTGDTGLVIRIKKTRSSKVDAAGGEATAPTATAGPPAPAPAPSPAPTPAPASTSGHPSSSLAMSAPGPAGTRGSSLGPDGAPRRIANGGARAGPGGVVATVGAVAAAAAAATSGRVRTSVAAAANGGRRTTRPATTSGEATASGQGAANGRGIAGAGTADGGRGAGVAAAVSAMTRDDLAATGVLGKRKAAVDAVPADVDPDYGEGEEAEEEEGYVLGESTWADRDFTSLELKPDHLNRPLWVCSDGRIFLETYSPVYKQAYDFLIAIAEPVCRPECIHEYSLTPHSLYAAVSVGLETSTVISVLDRLSKTKLPDEVKEFIRASTLNYGKVKLVLQRNRFFVESPNPEVLRELLQDDIISSARIVSPPAGNDAPASGEGFVVSKALQETATLDKDLLGTDEAVAEAMEKDIHAFEIQPEKVEEVKRRCLPGGLNYPMLEEYDFKNDTVNPDLNIELKPMTQVRPYQEKSLSKMFGNGRARSGIIVLPCGAGKSLVGVTAAARIKKSILCLCTNSVSVDQWRLQFRLWSTVKDEQIVKFTSESKEKLPAGPCVVVTTYNMVAFRGQRSEASDRIITEMKRREWGLLLMDEVHVVPAAMFRKVLSITHSHCKLGLTATLVREDERIADLNFLIGPKLYEANWLDLVQSGFLANVQCAEVWCPMTKEYYEHYLSRTYADKRQALYVMNPNKFRACEFLIRFHEETRGDKIIVFSDNIFALREYARTLKKPFIFGGTTHNERSLILNQFKTNPKVNVIFLSKVGDNSIDIPEANVIIQISSHAGSRRQEAQRLGRILRPKGRFEDRIAGGKEEYNAFFYSLVSTDTVEMYYSTKRQQFLIDQGYSFKVITNEQVPPPGSTGLHYETKKDQMDLLSKILAMSSTEAGEEQLADDADDITRQYRGGARRMMGSLSAMSGGQGRVYLEYSTGQPRAMSRGMGRGSQVRRDTTRRHHLFRSRYR